jgi:hypothetical protein
MTYRSLKLTIWPIILLVAAIGSTWAQSPIDQALKLLKASLECTGKPFVVAGANCLHSSRKYIGTSRVYSTYTEGICWRPGDPYSKRTMSFETTFEYSDVVSIERWRQPGPGCCPVTVKCRSRDGSRNDCNGTYGQLIPTCDQESAESIEIALKILVEGNK